MVDLSRPYTTGSAGGAPATGAAIGNNDHELAGRTHINLLGKTDYGRWDEFVSGCSQATFFHRAGWKDVIEEAFGHKACYLYAEREGKIGAILPLVHLRSRLFGNALISTPFCVYGGIVGDDTEACRLLEERALVLAEDLGVDYLEMRERGESHRDWLTKDLYVTFRKEIDPDPEQNYRSIPRKQRAMIRKGMDAGLIVKVDDGMDRFFGVYSESVRNLGTPVFGKQYFKQLKRVFGNDCRILTVWRGDRPVSSVMSFYFRDEVLPYYGGSVGSARSLKANDFMYWELMRRSAEEGIRIFDYGRSKKDSGSYRFKKHWGFAPLPLAYQYHLVRARQVPNVSPTNPKYQLLIRIWRRLPLAVTQILGPFISSKLG